VYEDRLAVARFTSQAIYNDINLQHASTTPEKAQLGGLAKLQAIDPHSPNAAAQQLDVYKQVLQGQPQPYLAPKPETYIFEAGIVVDDHPRALRAVTTYAAQMLECAYATVELKGLTGAAADLQIRAAMAVGEDAVRQVTSDRNPQQQLEFAQYHVQMANQILHHTQDKVALYGSTGGLDQVLQSNQNFLLQALDDVYKHDKRVISAEATGDAVAVARAKKEATQELLAA
jgi:hypothetical protein